MHSAVISGSHSTSEQIRFRLAVSGSATKTLMDPVCMWTNAGASNPRISGKELNRYSPYCFLICGTGFDSVVEDRRIRDKFGHRRFIEISLESPTAQYRGTHMTYRLVFTTTDASSERKVTSPKQISCYRGCYPSTMGRSTPRPSTKNHNAGAGVPTGRTRRISRVALRGSRMSQRV